MSLPTGLNINTIMGAAANSVSKTLEGRRTRSEQKADLFELKDRELDDEEELFRRKNRREQEAKTKEYIATISAYFGPEQASQIIAQAGGYNGLNIAATRIASLENNGYSAQAVYNTNTNLTNPNITDPSKLPIGSLFTRPPKKATEKDKNTFHAIFSSLSTQESNATSQTELNEIEAERKIATDNFLAWSELQSQNEDNGDEYKSRFNTETADAFVSKAFKNLFQRKHGYELDQTEKITQFMEGNKPVHLQALTEHSRRLEKIEQNFIDAGTQIDKEPTWMAAKLIFQEETFTEVNNYINNNYGTGENIYITEEDITAGFNYKNPDTFKLLTTTSSTIQDLINKRTFTLGQQIPFVTKDGNMAHYIWLGKGKFEDNTWLIED